MMKWGFAVNAVAGALLVATAIGSSDDGQGLQISLDRTLRELETLASLRSRIEQGDRDAIAEVKKFTDAPAEDSQGADARLDALRIQVAKLEMQRDALPPVPARLDARPARDPKAAQAKDGAPGSSLTAFEAEGFSADIVKQGEVLFRAERFEDCAKLLEKSPDEPRARYWRARSLEHLGKSDEAIEIYTELSALKGSGWAAERARADLDYLTWKKSLEAAPAKTGHVEAKTAETHKP